MNWILLLIVGLLSGLLSGLLGVGGGVILVPGLALAFHWLHFPSISIMHYATSTSLSIIAVSSLVGIYQYAKLKLIRGRIVFQLIPGILIGVAGGINISNRLSSHTLGIIFGILLILISAKMAFFKNQARAQSLPHPIYTFLFSLILGILSGLLGVGGGVLIIPFLMWCGLPMREASGTSLTCTLMIAIFGVLCSLLIDGTHSHTIPWSSGYIYWPAFIVVAAGSVIGVPLGVRIAMKLNTQWLTWIFSVFLLVVGISLFF